MLLFVCTIIPLLALFPLYGTKNAERAHALGIAVGLLAFAVTLYFWIIFDELTMRPQIGVEQLSSSFVWNHAGPGPEYFVFAPPFVHMGVDGLSVFFLILTAFLVPFCIAFGERSIEFGGRTFAALLFLMESLLLVAFATLDLVTFYAFFEGTVMPMFLIIGIWGSRSRRIHAAFYLLYYTLVGSTFMLGGILFFQSKLGSSSIYGLLMCEMSERECLVLWFLFFLGFGFKVPIIPFHI
jgi:NADH:ubiquinone oxidoreductase subunit 4 (subunit M)